MLNNSSKILFLSILMMGTMITISSNSWLGAWMGLEINLLAFIPLMSDNNNLMSTESSLKYFLTQALASAVLLFAIITMLLESNMFINNSNYFVNMMMLSSLMLKSGTAPFHFWFPNVMEGLSWNNSLILMTWQKIAPLMLISYLIECKMFIMICIISSSIIGAIGGMNQTSLRKLMAFSSINHLSWMISAMYASENLWFLYFMFYSFLSFSVIFLFKMFNLSHINQLFSIFFSSKILKFTMFMNLLSMGGLPPFLGFIPKWFVIQSLVISNQLLLMSILVTMTLVALFFYLRMCYTAFMLNYFENSWMMNMKFNKFSMNLYLTCSFMSIFGMFIISMIFYLF